jgi:HSP20 family molecular chaperone IbpA
LGEIEAKTVKKPSLNRSAKDRRNTLFRVLDGVLSLSHRKIHSEGNSDKAKDFDFVVRERVYSHVYKQLPFPEEVIPEEAESTFRDGLLSVYIPKKTVLPAPKKHKVAVK